MSKKISMREELINVLEAGENLFAVNKLIDKYKLIDNTIVCNLLNTRKVAIDDLNTEIDNFISAIETHVSEAISNSINQHKE